MHEQLAVVVEQQIALGATPLLNGTVAERDVIVQFGSETNKMVSKFVLKCKKSVNILFAK